MKVGDIKPCGICGKGVAHSRDIVFYEVEISQHLLDQQAIRRHAGMEMMMGNAAVAAVLSPVSDISQEVSKSRSVMCQPCFLEYFGHGWEALAEAAA